jgi:Flp pilus assembly pilin Flp
MAERAATLLRDESGQDMIEYALLAAFVAVMVVAIPFPSLQNLLTGIYERVSSALSAAIG